MRSLAAELGIHHTTLYTYAPHIEDVRGEVIAELATHIPLPHVDASTPLRTQLIAHLRVAREIALIQPDVMSPPIGSPAWDTLSMVSVAWISALAEYTPDLGSAGAAYTALVATVNLAVTREHAYGSEGVARIARASEASALGIGGVDQVLDRLIDMLLPGLADGVDPAAEARTRPRLRDSTTKDARCLTRS